MNRLSAIIAGGILTGMAFTSCDSVSEPDRFVPAEIVPQRAVLIEEYTGQMCTNCPDGHAAVRDILAALGDSIVPVSIHASQLALDPPIGLRTATGEAYYKAAGSPALPAAVIDMQTPPLQVADWGRSIDKLVMESTPFTIVAKGEVSADEANYDITVDFSSGIDYQGKLMVWILENNVIRMQLDHGTTVAQYEHNHVFNAAATPDIWGEEVDLKAHEPQHLSYSYPMGRYWKKNDLYVVAFLYNDEGVAQVTSSASH